MNAKINSTVTIKKFVWIIFSLLSVIVSTSSLAWDGYDWDRGSYVDIGKGNLVRKGREIEYFDYRSGDYRRGDVESIRSHGSKFELEVYDYESGEYRTFEMDK